MKVIGELFVSFYEYVIFGTTKVVQKNIETVDIIWAVCYNMHVIKLTFM